MVVAFFVVDVVAGSAAFVEVVGIGAALATAEDAGVVDEGTAAEDERCLQRWVLARLRTRCPGMAMGAGAATRAAMAWWWAAWRTAWGGGETVGGSGEGGEEDETLCEGHADWGEREKKEGVL